WSAEVCSSDRGQQAVHLLDVLHRAHLIALVIEKAFQQTAQARIVIDYEDLFAFVGGCRAAHRNSRKSLATHYGAAVSAQAPGIVNRFFPPGEPDGARALPRRARGCFILPAFFAQARPASLDRRQEIPWISTPASPKNWPYARSRWPPPSPCSTWAPPCTSSRIIARKSPAAWASPSCSTWSSAFATCASWLGAAARSW